LVLPGVRTANLTLASGLPEVNLLRLNFPGMRLEFHVLDTPVVFLFPMFIVFPTLPVMVKPIGRDLLIVPRMALPMALPVIVPPAGGDA